VEVVVKTIPTPFPTVGTLVVVNPHCAARVCLRSGLVGCPPTSATTERPSRDSAPVSRRAASVVAEAPRPPHGVLGPSAHAPHTQHV
jgi:hypothetical protein